MPLGAQKQKIIFFFSSFFFWFSLYVYMPFQTTYLLILGYSSTLVGIIVGAYGLTQLLLRVPVGISADLYGRHKPIMLSGIALAALASAVRILFPTDAGFLIGGLISGAAASTWISFMVFHAGLYSEKEQQKANSLSITSSNSGIFCAFLTGFLLYDRLGMSLICLASVLGGAISFLFCLTIREKAVPDRQRLPLRELVSVCKNKQMIVFALIALVQQGVVLTTAMSFTTQHAREIGATGTQIGLSSIVYILAAVFSAFACSTRFFVRLGGKLLVPVVFFGLALYCILVPFTSAIWQIYLIQILAGFSQGAGFSLCNSESMAKIPREKRSTGMGFFQAIYALGMTVLPIVCGRISAVWSMAAAYFLLAALCVCAVILSLWFYQAQQKRL